MQVLFPNHDIVTLFDQSSGHTINDIGPYPAILKGGMLQSFDFPKVEERSYESSLLRKISSTIVNGHENQFSSGYIFDRRNYRKPELQGLAQNRNIVSTILERKLVEGWAGKRKGYLQILWETGHIDPCVH